MSCLDIIGNCDMENSTFHFIQVFGFVKKGFVEQVNFGGATRTKISGFNTLNEWKRINFKQSDRWQHLSRLKASAFYFEFF